MLARQLADRWFSSVIETSNSNGPLLSAISSQRRAGSMAHTTDWFRCCKRCSRGSRVKDKTACEDPSTLRSCIEFLLWQIIKLNFARLLFEECTQLAGSEHFLTLLNCDCYSTRSFSA